MVKSISSQVVASERQDQTWIIIINKTTKIVQDPQPDALSELKQPTKRRKTVVKRAEIIKDNTTRETIMGIVEEIEMAISVTVATLY